MKYKITKKQFKYFQDCCEFYIDMLGLKDWEMYYELKSTEGALAACAANTGDRIACITLSTPWEDQEPTDEELKEAACHEILELLMWELYMLARTRFINDDQLEGARHAIVRRLEKVLVKLKRE